MLRRMLVWGMLAALSAVMLTACGGGLPEDPAVQAVAKMMNQPENVEQWKTAPLFGGTAVLADDAHFWLAPDGKVMTADGYAAMLAPNLPDTPPSITGRTITRAIDGEAIETAVAFALPYQKFLQDFGDAVAPVPFKKDIYRSYKLGDFGLLNIEEQGGQVTQINLNGYFRKDTADDYASAVIALVQTAPFSDKSAASKAFSSLLKQAKATAGEAKRTTVAGVNLVITYTANEVLDIIATPAV